MQRGLMKPINQPSPNRVGVTFKDSKATPLHRWYPYVEGFSAEYIRAQIENSAGGGIVFDPFGGSGTVNLIAAQSGFESWFCEANPLMRLIALTKINSVHAISERTDALSDAIRHFTDLCNSNAFSLMKDRVDLDQYKFAFNGREFFDETHLRELLVIRNAIKNFHQDEPLQSILLVALASITVSCSNMTRRADLRRRRPGEYKNRRVDVRTQFLTRLSIFLEDIIRAERPLAPTVCAGNDSRVFVKEIEGRVDLILTSPPYLNGTNYIRNTKLELWLLDFIRSEKDLPILNKVCMVCGINNVSKKRPPKYIFEFVEEVASILDIESPDQRIPAMVRGYFSDMREIFQNCEKYLTKDGRLVMDIGDSKFYGVHVKTDKLLIEVAKNAGLRLTNENLLARRMSKDKSPLHQVELIFERQ